SELKGGRLAQATRAEVVALVLSDVIGNDLATIGSGPVSPDPTTFAEALAICAALAVPPRVRAALEAGARGELPETPERLENVRARVLAGPDDLVRAAAGAARARGYDVETRAGLTGRVDEVAALLAAQDRPFVGGGEPTVVLPPHPGRGGRAQ